jgi:hypothetical protein
MTINLKEYKTSIVIVLVYEIFRGRADPHLQVTEERWSQGILFNWIIELLRKRAGSSARSPFDEVTVLSVRADLTQFLSGSSTVPKESTITARTDLFDIVWHGVSRLLDMSM